MQNLIRSLLKQTWRFSVKPVFNPLIPLPYQRRWVEGLSAINLAAPGTVCTPVQLPSGCSVDVWQPKKWQGRYILYLHGGAYCLGSTRTHRSLISWLCRQTGASVWATVYRLAPENPYPASLNDALETYREMLARGFPSNRIILAGDSAGAGLAVQLALAIRDQELPRPKAMVLISPWLDLFSDRPRGPADHDDPVISRAWLKQCAKAVAPEEGGRSAMTKPLNTSLADLPPTLIQVAVGELLHSDSQRLAERMKDSDVAVELQEFRGLWHVFQLHAGMLEVANEALQGIAGFLNRVREKRHKLPEGALRAEGRTEAPAAPAGARQPDKLGA